MSNKYIGTKWDEYPEEYALFLSYHEKKRQAAIIEDFIYNLTQIKQSHSLKICDIGAGIGKITNYLARRFPECRFTGIEPNPKFVSFCVKEYNETNNLDFISSCIEDYEENVRFDFVYSIEMLHHVIDYWNVINVVKNLLAPSAFWLVFEPNIFNPIVNIKQAIRPYERNYYPWKFLRFAKDNRLLI